MRLHVILSLLFVGARGAGITDPTEAQEFLDDYNIKAGESLNQRVKASWAYNTDITDENSDLMIEENIRLAAFAKAAAENASRFDWANLADDYQKRQFQKITDIGTAAMQDEEKLIRLNSVLADLQDMYSTGEVCDSTNRCQSLDPDLTDVMANVRDAAELERVWKGWRDATGKKMRTLFQEYVELSNEAVSDAGYADTGEYWRSWYETETFQTDVAALFEQLKPLYEQLHAYTRTKLQEIYGESIFPPTRHIPAHILGNMWAQQWNNLYEDLVPFKGKPSMDITDELVNQNYTITRMYEVSDQFFTSLGMAEMPPLFWSNSMLEKPADGRDVVCHASAWDFYDQEDFRAISVSRRHIEYFLQYKDKPVIFRRGANPGFHEGIADVASLSFQTPKHLYGIGLIHDLVDDNEADINFLFNMALQKIAFLPFGYLIDQWRWEVFSGATQPAEYNTKWWELRCRLQGVSPPVRRSESDFDPGAKFHVPGNVAYIRYFVSFVIQFQFHKALCNAVGHTGPLHKCSIYNSTEAGTAFSDMLRLGSSKPWPEAMLNLTGSSEMSASALMEYFQPLTTWLTEHNQNQGTTVGWDNECPEFPDNLHDSATSVTLSTLCLLLSSLFFLFRYLK